MSRVEVDEFVDKRHYNDQDQLHREDGPAVEYSNGDKYWWLNGQQHRVDGPAIELADGSKIWCLHGKLHREDGPAEEWADGHKEWCLHGKLHRDNGPAMEYPDGSKQWYLEDEGYTEEEFYVEIAKRHGCDLSNFPQLAYDYCLDHQLIDTNC